MQNSQAISKGKMMRKTVYRKQETRAKTSVNKWFYNTYKHVNSKMKGSDVRENKF